LLFGKTFVLYRTSGRHGEEKKMIKNSGKAQRIWGQENLKVLKLGAQTFHLLVSGLRFVFIEDQGTMFFSLST
jgi:hypothetical protein